MQIKSNPGGSFGIPPKMKEAVDRHEEQRGKPPEERPPAGPMEEKEEPQVEDTPQEEVQGDGGKATVNELNPQTLLKKIKVSFTEQDLHQLLFKGYVEKEVEVIPPMKKDSPSTMTASMKTLTGDEYDMIDEILAEEAENTKMTTQGFDSRKAMWILSFGVTKLQGKPIAKPVMIKNNAGQDTKELDLKETARSRRKVIGLLSPAVSNPLVEIHGTLTVAVQLIARKPDSLLKNS